jgi:uncharacterized protein (TIGR03437 family)
LAAATLPRGADFDAISGVFQWIPTADQQGTNNIAFTATGQEGSSAINHVSIEVDSGAPAATRVVNAASHSGDLVCSAGAMASVEGKWLAADSVSDPAGTSLALVGTRIRINGGLVPILYVSPTRVDFQCPDAASDTKLSIVVETEHGTTQPIETVVSTLAPGIFTLAGSGAGQGVAMHAGTLNLAMVPNYEYAGQPAQPGDRLVIRTTGIQGAMRTFVNINGIEVTPDSVDLIPEYAGVTQIAFTIPLSAISGNATTLSVTCQSWDGTLVTSNIATVAIER